MSKSAVMLMLRSVETSMVMSTVVWTVMLMAVSRFVVLRFEASRRV